MKKYFLNGSIMLKLRTLVLAGLTVAALSLQSCSKDHAAEESSFNPDQPAKLVRIRASHEPLIDATSGTKVALSETDDNFSLFWVGGESLKVTTSTSTASSDFAYESMDDSGVATFTGNVPSAGTATATNYIAITTDAWRTSINDYLVGTIKRFQKYNPTNNAQHALLVARGSTVDVGNLDQPFAFKTMNSFMKFSLTKGTPAPGATFTYDKMFLQSIKIEAINGENISGSFKISKSSDDFYNAYEGVYNSEGYSDVVLDCVSSSFPSGPELSSDGLDFYIAVAFGNYSGGLRVTFNVRNADGKKGRMVKTIASSTGKTLVRNRLYVMPSIAVNPADNTEDDTYELIDNPSDVEAGTYYLAAHRGSDYQLWTGTLSSNKDGVTATYSFNGSTGVLTGTGAVEVTLVNMGTYYVLKYNDQYLYSTNYANSRTLALTSTQSSASHITFTEREGGGMIMVLTNPSDASQHSYVVTGDAASNQIRNYKSNTTGVYGIVLFKLVGSGSGGGGGGGGGGGDPGDGNYGYLELPVVPTDLGSNRFFTLYATMSGVQARNYSALYNPTYYAQMWTAYPLHKNHMGTGRNSSWYANPLIPTSLQTKLTKSYGGSFNTVPLSGGGSRSNLYSRGHQIANSDRSAIDEMQSQTFYWTNSTPQIQNGFNGNIWNNLESAIQNYAKSYSDTLYIVTGPVYQTLSTSDIGGGETVSYWDNQNDDKSIAVPNYYFKVVLKVHRNSSGVIDNAKCVGYWFDHRDYGSITYTNYHVSVATIESRTGFSFFANLPSTIAGDIKDDNITWTQFTSSF